MSINVIILAAGQGKRMQSALPKVLHPLLGEPMLGHVLGAAAELNPASIAVVCGHGGDQVRAFVAAWSAKSAHLLSCLTSEAFSKGTRRYCVRLG